MWEPITADDIELLNFAFENESIGDQQYLNFILPALNKMKNDEIRSDRVEKAKAEYNRLQNVDTLNSSRRQFKRYTDAVIELADANSDFIFLKFQTNVNIGNALYNISNKTFLSASEKEAAYGEAIHHASWGLPRASSAWSSEQQRRLSLQRAKFYCNLVTDYMLALHAINDPIKLSVGWDAYGHNCINPRLVNALLHAQLKLNSHGTRLYSDKLEKYKELHAYLGRLIEKAIPNTPRHLRFTLLPSAIIRSYISGDLKQAAERILLLSTNIHDNAPTIYSEAHANLAGYLADLVFEESCRLQEIAYRDRSRLIGEDGEEIFHGHDDNIVFFTKENRPITRKKECFTFFPQNLDNRGFSIRKHQLSIKLLKLQYFYDLTPTQGIYELH